MNSRDGNATPRNDTPPVIPEFPEILIIGVNHTSAQVDLRECLAFTPEETLFALSALKKLPVIREVLIVSTCNRVEILMTSPDPDAAEAAVKRYIAEAKAIPIHRFESAIYAHTGLDAIRHLFRVASSLDSMIVGEPQILGQVKNAYKFAVDNRGTGVILNRLLHKAFSVAKRVRSETGIGDRAVSISYAAVELARKIFGDLEGKTVLLVGAGEMAELAVEHLQRNRRSGALFVANRTFAVGVDLARRFSGTPLRFDEIPESLKSVDIIISSTGSPDYVITKGMVKPIMRERKNRPLFFIDIAVPRDIDPAINRIENAYVYDIDDLQGVIDENLATRKDESLKAERIIDEAVIRFHQWYDSLDTVPTIKDLRNKMTVIAETELAKTVQSMHSLSEEDRLALHRMTDAMIKKILHDPMQFLKNPGSHRDKSLYIDVTRKIFNLEDE